MSRQTAFNSISFKVGGLDGLAFSSDRPRDAVHGGHPSQALSAQVHEPSEVEGLDGGATAMSLRLGPAWIAF